LAEKWSKIRKNKKLAEKLALKPRDGSREAKPVKQLAEKLILMGISDWHRHAHYSLLTSTLYQIQFFCCLSAYIMKYKKASHKSASAGDHRTDHVVVFDMRSLKEEQRQQTQAI